MKTWLRLTIGLLVLINLGWAGGWHLPADAASPTLTLQERIDAAPDGAVLDITPGTYTENLTIHDKSLTLRGSDPLTTIIQAADSNTRVITADSAKGLTLQGLTITGGHLSDDPGGAVYAAGGTLQIISCHITDNSAIYGGGVFLDDPASSLAVSYSLVNLNTATLQGGGIFADGHATVINTNFDSNTAGGHGGAIHVQNGATNIIIGAFTNNQATGGNGGAVNVNNDLSITSGHFNNNSSSNQGGAVTQWNTGKVVTISASTFASNTAYSQGGGAYIGGDLTLTNSDFVANVVDSLSSGGNVYGGGLYSLGKLTVDGSTFSRNVAQCVSCSFNVGGGLDSEFSTSPITITNSVFDGNKGWFGGAVSGKDINAAYSIFKNSASGGYGGGINAINLVGDNLLFQDNTVINNGGGVAATQIMLYHSRFIHNVAMNGGAIYSYGDFAGSNLLFARNAAWTNGAAVYLKSSATSTLFNLTIAQPTQGTGIAIYVEPNAVLSLYDSIANNYTNAVYLGGTGATLNEDYNLFYHNVIDIVMAPGGIYNPGGHSGNQNPPGFIAPLTDNYHLLASSKAIGWGHDYGLTDDLDGHLRLNGRNDAGAYQFWNRGLIPLLLK